MGIKSRSLTEIHSAVLLFGLAGLFGKLLPVPSLIITFGRVLFAFLALLIILLFKKQSVKLLNKDYFIFLISGLILSIHWFSFFRSIQISTIAIGLVTYSTFPVFTAFIEPYFFKEKFNVKNLVPAIFAFAGILLVIPKYESGDNLTQGALWGILSGMTFALLQTFNRKYVKKYSSIVITFYQAGIAAVILSPFLFIYSLKLTGNDVILIIILGVVFTALAHTLFINGLRNIKAYNAGIIALLEPVYGIIAAFLFLKEIPSIRVIAGGVIILLTAFYITFYSKKN
jgi:drug/metabolite transporter (DMT)-like permease